MLPDEVFTRTFRTLSFVRCLTLLGADRLGVRVFAAACVFDGLQIVALRRAERQAQQTDRQPITGRLIVSRIPCRATDVIDVVEG